MNLKMIDILEKELIPALGCTEPVAMGLCSATARKYAPGKIKEIVCEASAMVLKGLPYVKIPRTGGKRGCAMACAVGAVGGDSDLEMEVFSTVSEEDVKEAEDLVNRGVIKVNKAISKYKLYIKITIITDQGSAQAIIQEAHNNVAYIEQNGVPMLDKREISPQLASQGKELDYSCLSVKSIYDFCTTVPVDDLRIIKDTISITRRICEEGMNNPYGLQVGKNIRDNVGQGIIGLDISSNAMMWTAAGVDARMGGSNLPAMSNSGSGNQGITCTMPVVATGDYLKRTQEQIIRGVAISNLLTIYIKTYYDRNYARMAPVCCAAVAAGGAGCGIAYLYGYGVAEMESILKTVLGNVAGLFCDGAKGNCALKVSTNINGAIQAMIMAKDGLSAGQYDGIVGQDVPSTILNFFRIQKEGMANIEDVIYSIEMQKQEIC